MPEKKQNIWGDIAYVIVFTGAFVGVVYILRRLSWIPQLGTSDVFVLFGAYLALAFSALLNAYASEGYAYHRLGYDLCALTLGTSLSLLAALALSKTDVLPHLGTALAGATIGTGHQAAIVGLMGFASVLAMLGTARIVRSLDGDENPKGESLLALLSFLIGLGMLFAYALLLVGSGG